MATLNTENPFQSWVLTPEEFLAGSILTITQKQVIQNQIAQLAMTRLNFKIDVQNPLAILQEEADLKGQILALQYLLTLSASSEAQMNPGAQNISINADQS
jgi:hypothetical protein